MSKSSTGQPNPLENQAVNRPRNRGKSNSSIRGLLVHALSEEAKTFYLRLGSLGIPETRNGLGGKVSSS